MMKLRVLLVGKPLKEYKMGLRMHGIARHEKRHFTSNASNAVSATVSQIATKLYTVLPLLRKDLDMTY